MSFRTRLSLFLVLIVIVPMASLTLVLFRLIDDNENGKLDAGVGARQETAQRLVDEARSTAARRAAAVSRDVSLATALQRGRPAEARARATQLLRSLALERLVIARDDGAPVVDVGSRRAVFPARLHLQDATGRSFGLLQVSAQEPRAFAASVKRLTRMEVVLRRGSELLASTSAPAARLDLPRPRGRVQLGGTPFMASTSSEPGFGAIPVRVGVLASTAGIDGDSGDARLPSAAIVLGFCALAFCFAIIASRSLRRQMEGLLRAARRLGGGDFSARVPTVGRDEFAELGAEFNRMSEELERRLEDLRAQQERLAGAMRRIGETFAANLDRDGLLAIVLRTALDGAGAVGGRAALRDGPDAPLRTVAEAGSLTGVEAAIDDAEARALATGASADVAQDGAHALAHPLRTTKHPPMVNGVVAVARADRAFTDAERELFEYLAQQAAVSVENVGLHETVERQAVTDELTGLANRRRFQETLSTEIERSRRFEAPLSLLMIDLDDFKLVNDDHGHLAGDLVLREVGRVVRESSREIDTPARYGGEELAMVLPGTDLGGAHRAAERVRERIAQLELQMPDGGTVAVTASVGAATHPASAGGARELVAAADAALYEAKRAGKNRTVLAAPVTLRDGR